MELSPLEAFGEHFWRLHRYGRQRKNPEGHALLLKHFRAAWKQGDEDVRCNVLTFLMGCEPMVGMDILRKAARDPDRTVKGTAAICYMRYASADYVFSRADLNYLRSLARDTTTGRSTRGIAIHALVRAKVPGLASLLNRAAISDPSAGNRIQARLHLADLGRKVVSSELVTNLEKFDADEVRWDEPAFSASSIWHTREKLNLSESELEPVRARILPLIEKYRQRARQHDVADKPMFSNRNALSLFHWIKEGFPYENRDIDLLGAAAFFCLTVKDQIDSTKAISWFETERAVYLLSEIATHSPSRGVRREARRQLRTLASKN